MEVKMKKNILLITLLVSTLGMATEIRSPEETGAGISEADIKLIESMKRDEVKIEKMTLEEMFKIFDFKSKNPYKGCKINCYFGSQYSKSLLELLDYDTDDLQNIYKKDAEQKLVKQQK